MMALGLFLLGLVVMYNVYVQLIPFRIRNQYWSVFRVIDAIKLTCGGLGSVLIFISIVTFAWRTMP